MPGVLLIVSSLSLAGGDPTWVVRVDDPNLLATLAPNAAIEALGGPFYRVREPQRAALEGRPGVRGAWLEQRRRVILDQVSADPSESLQWHLANDGSRTDLWPKLAAGADIDVHPAWEVSTGDPSVVVAVLDNGFPAEHPDLPAAGRLQGWDFVDDDPDPAPAGTSTADAHGLAVAATLLAPKNGVGVVGVCPDCRLLPLRVLAGDQTLLDGDLVAALAWAGRHAAVINCSWSFDPGAYVSPAIHEAIQWASTAGRDGRGAVVVFSAGNRHRDIRPYSPAAMPEVLAVGATDETDTVAGYSDFGAGLSLVAPGGVGDDSIDGVVVARAKIVTADLEGDAGYNPTTDTRLAPGVANDLSVTAAFFGTSAAAPQVAGAAGLLLAAAPALTAAEVRWLLTESARRIGPDAYDDNGWNPRHGHGRLDVGAAMQLAVVGPRCEARPETCANGVDDDCDRARDAADPDCGAAGPTPFALSLATRCDNETDCKDGYCGPADGAFAVRFCTADCDYDCPADGACVGPTGFGRCLLSCRSEADCQGGSRCAFADPGLVPAGQVPRPVCLPLCEDDRQCHRAFCRDGVCAGASRAGAPLTLATHPGCSCGPQRWGVAVTAALLPAALRRRRARGHLLSGAQGGGQVPLAPTRGARG
ncbi:MAG: S8 family serine peptidase [Deltaproteobacteria bacterium]|nr:S8 family serine peptidase [Deltaproteobacteria bacterium]